MAGLVDTMGLIRPSVPAGANPSLCCSTYARGKLDVSAGRYALVTVGIYVPRTVQVRCEGSGADLDLSEDEVRRIVSDPVFLDRVEALLPDQVEAVQQARTAFLKQ